MNSLNDFKQAMMDDEIKTAMMMGVNSPKDHSAEIVRIMFLYDDVVLLVLIDQFN